MNISSELRLSPLRMIGLAELGNWRADPASVAPAPSESQVVGAAAPAQDERPTARPRLPEPVRAQGAEQRLKKNRLEQDQSQNGMRVPEREASFGDFLDLINPLHHIPIVGTIYRAITGDEIGGPARILGGMLFGGPIGFIAAAFDTILTQATGRDLGETVMAAFIDRDAAPAAQVAEARDIQSIPAQDGASEDSPPMASGAPGPISGHRDPFGLERGAAAPIAVMPGALMPVAVTSVALSPSPQAATVRGTGLGWIRIYQTPFAGSPDLVNPIAINNVAQTHAVEGVADGDSNQTRSALGGKPRVPAAPGPGALPVLAVTGAPVAAVKLVSADASQPGNQRLVPNIATTDRGFTERMLEALDKYQAQASERYRDNSRAIRRLDLAL